MLFPTTLLLWTTLLVLQQCHAEDMMISDAPNGTDVDIVLITLNDDMMSSNTTVEPSPTMIPSMADSVGTATMMPSMADSPSATAMPSMTDSSSATDEDETTTAPSLMTPSPSAPVQNLVLNTEPTTLAPFPTIAIPPQAPQSRPPMTNAPIVSDVPSMGPTLFPATSIAACAAHSQCANLAGDCCPTATDNVYLDCCGVGAIEETCSLNNRCTDEWGLTGSCCPTLTGVYLDCCDVVPDECQDPLSSNCTVFSTREYVESSARMMSGTAVVLILSAMMMMAL